jgi:hypothetical protein
MREHLTELELARAAAGDGSENLIDHLRWCGQCRTAVAEYGWLQEEIERTLEAEAAGAPVPEADWMGARERLQSTRPVSAVGRRAAAVSLAAAVCLVVAVPLAVAGGNRAWAMAPRTEEVSTAPSPAAVVENGRVGTPTSPAGRMAGRAERVSLPFVPPPTPPEPQV